MSGSLVPFPSGRQKLILDSWPIMEWLKAREPVASYVDSLIANAKVGTTLLLLSTINLGEIYYNCWNEWGQTRSNFLREEFLRLPVQVVHPTEEDVHTAAGIKGKYKVAYADAFAAVLALGCDAPVLSGDPDFLKLRDSGLISVEWVGA